MAGLLCLCFFIVLRRKVFASVDTIYRDCFKNERVSSDSWSRFAEKPGEVENLLTLVVETNKGTNKHVQNWIVETKSGSSTALD